MSTGFEKITTDSQLQDHWIRRVIAFIIDSIITWICTFFIGVIIWLPFYLAALATGLPWYMFNPFSFPFFAGILTVLYFALFETYFGGTFGKRIMNLEVTGLNSRDPTLDSAFIRNGSKIYWVLILVDAVIGLAMTGDPRQKATDRIAGTTVISAGSSPISGAPKTQTSAGFCPQCGKQLPTGAEYCPYCGKEQD